MTPTETLIRCFKESGHLTLDALVFESDLDEEVVLASLQRLQKEGRVELNNGIYRLYNARHARKIKTGLLLKSIPSL